MKRLTSEERYAAQAEDATEDRARGVGWLDSDARAKADRDADRDERWMGGEL